MTLSILAIETCSEACSVALLHREVVIQKISTEPRGHADNILPMIETLLESAKIQLKELDVIAFTRGPGAFTGVRIGTSVAQGLSVASGIPLIALSSLAVLAQGSFRRTGQTHSIATLDARMSEVYYGFYQCNDKNIMIALQDDKVDSPQNIEVLFKHSSNDNDQWNAIGAGWTHYYDAMSARFKDWLIDAPEELFYPEARDLITLARQDYLDNRMIDAADALPVYVRDQVVRGKN